jgi:hypothetical protein
MNSKEATEDRSPPLALTFSEQQWLIIGSVIAQKLHAANCHPHEKETLLPIALKLQQTLNRIWRASWPDDGKGLYPVVNFAGRQEVDQKYLYGHD